VTVSVNVKINGCWESLEIVAPHTVWKTLAGLSESRLGLSWLRRMSIFQSLIFYYEQEITKEPLPRGVHKGFRETAWRTARVLMPLFLTWAENSAEPRTKPFKAIAHYLKKEDHHTITSHLVACYLVRRNIENSGKPWPGVDPCQLTPFVFKQKLGKRSPEWRGFQYPGPRIAKLFKDTDPFNLNFAPNQMAELITCILDGECLLASCEPGRLISASF